MSTQIEGRVPTWTRGDRLRKARTDLGLTVKDFAKRALISEKTINDYEGDRINRVAPLRIEKWATVTGVNREWLETGNVPDPDGGGEAESGRRDSNPQHSAWKVAPLHLVAAA